MFGNWWVASHLMLGFYVLFKLKNTWSLFLQLSLYFSFSSLCGRGDACAWFLSSWKVVIELVSYWAWCNSHGTLIHFLLRCNLFLMFVSDTFSKEHKPNPLKSPPPTHSNLAPPQLCPSPKVLYTTIIIILSSRQVITMSNYKSSLRERERKKSSNTKYIASCVLKGICQLFSFCYLLLHFIILHVILESNCTWAKPQGACVPVNSRRRRRNT